MHIYVLYLCVLRIDNKSPNYKKRAIHIRLNTRKKNMYFNKNKEEIKQNNLWIKK